LTGISTEQKTGVFLVAESCIARLGALLLISQQEDIEVVGETGSADDAFSITGDITPETVILHAIPPKGSFKLTFRLREVLPEISVIALAEYEDDEGLFQAIITGASAFITKVSTKEKIFETIRRVANGERLISRNVLRRPRVALRILEQFQILSSMAKGFEPLVAPLSFTEEEVLQRIVNGNPTELIANYLNISELAVVDHITSILHKLDFNERTRNTAESLLTGDMR